MNKKALLIIGLMIGCIGSSAQAWGHGWGWGYGAGWGWGGYPYGYGYGPEAAAVYGASDIIGGAIAGHQYRRAAEANAAAEEARTERAAMQSGKQPRAYQAPAKKYVAPEYQHPMEEDEEL